MGVSQRRIRLMVVDDEPKLRAVWERVVQGQSDIELVGSLNRADSLAAAVGESRPDVVLLDLTMPGMDPIVALGDAARAFPETRIMIYSVMVNESLIRRAMDAGAWGHVDKLDDPRRILDAVRRVARGDVVLPR
jgi:DNA-binding NarL/FixJ family response regulator